MTIYMLLEQIIIIIIINNALKKICYGCMTIDDELILWYCGTTFIFVLSIYLLDNIHL
jgi:hypothetical protein